MADLRDTGLVRRGTAAHLDRMGENPLGRDGELDQIHGFLRDMAGPRLVLVRGERGIGRSAFVGAAAERLRAEGIEAQLVTCMPDDCERPLLLAMRIVMALDARRPTVGRRPTCELAVETLSAVERGDRTAMAEALAAALTQRKSVVVVVDDAQYADVESLVLLDEFDFGQVPPGIRLVVTAVQHTEAGENSRRRQPSRSGRAVKRLARGRKTDTIDLPRLGREEVTAVVTRRLQSLPSAELVQRVHELSRGIPGALDALLVEWAGQGAIRMADGHGFLAIGDAGAAAAGR